MTQVRQREAQRIFEAAVARYQMYPEYRDSGIEWLGEIPAHWDTVRLKLLCEINPGKFGLSNAPADMEVSFLPMENIGENGELDLSEVRVLDAVANGYTHFRDDDVIIAKITPCFENGKGALVRGLVNGVGFGTTELYVLRVGNQVIPEFIYYLTRSTSFRSPGIAMMQGAAGQKRVRTDFIADYPVSLPPIDEQRAITTFLDRQTAKIDALIAKKREVIAALHEKRSAIISHAVTKGLNLDAPMKDSGIEWLGAIPSHWEIIRSKRLFSVRNERAWADDQQLSATQAYGVILQEEFEERVGRQVVKINKNLEQRSHVEKDDFVISMRSFQGGLERAWVQGCIRSSYIILKPNSSVDINFFMYLFKSTSYIQALQATADFIRDGQDLTFRNFSLVDLPVIPIDEQRAIAEYLSKTTHEIDQLIETTSETIDRLQEYRAALISAAVTGKIDVRTG